MDNTKHEPRGAGRRYELWLFFGDWNEEGFAATPEQVAADYGVEFERAEGDAASSRCGRARLRQTLSTTDGKWSAWA